MTRPKFLMPEDILDLKEDTCLFCYGNSWSEQGDYSFGFYFSDESLAKLLEMQRKIYDETRRTKEHELATLKRDLESRFSGIGLSDSHLETAISSILSEQSGELVFNPMYGKTPLEIRIMDVFYNLRMGDLSLVPKDRLKSHQRCWPWNPFDGEVIFKIPYQAFFNQVMQNPRFEGYGALFDEFPGLLDSTLRFEIMLNAKAHDVFSQLNSGGKR